MYTYVDIMKRIIIQKCILSVIKCNNTALYLSNIVTESLQISLLPYFSSVYTEYSKIFRARVERHN